MIGQTFSHYHVVDRLGSGGMGDVYLAEDLRLGRVVALKFLSAERGRDDEALARFRHEARAASALDHPNICTIHEIDEWSDGRPFIAMAYCEGQTLKERLIAGPTPLPDALKFARQIADALAKAHEHGIVHRDIKPANLIATREGTVKVVDFGIAKLSDSPALTRTGASIGTPRYMAPEQISGGDADKQSDLWSLGVVLYEMIAGQAPFHGETATEVIGAILHLEPASLTSLRPGVPAIVDSIVRRLLNKRRSDRYATAREVSEDLTAAERALSSSAATPSSVKAHRSSPRPAVLILVAALILVGLVAAWSLSRPDVPRDATDNRAALGPPAPAVSSSNGRNRIAVLPFANLGSPDDAFFADGITEEITSRLAGVRGIAVISRSSATQYERRGKNLRQVGSDLGVNYLLEGSVRWARGSDGSQVRISPLLIRVSDDTTVWSHIYDATLDDVFKVQTDIAHQVIQSLQVALDPNERRFVEARRTADNEAYLAYLRGLTAHQRGASDTRNQAVARAEFERAVERDENFALAWAWLARVYATQYGTGAYRQPEMLELARQAVRKALDLDPALPEALIAHAFLHQLNRDYDVALKKIEAARAAVPNSSELLTILANVELRRGRWPESLAAYTRALDLDPRYAPAALGAAVHQMCMRKYPEALRFVHLASAADPSASTAVPEAWILFTGMRDLEAARRVLASGSLDDARLRALLARLELFDGRYDRALELIRGLPAAGAWMPSNFRFPAAIAEGQVYDAMGKADEAAERYRVAVATLEEWNRRSGEDYQTEASLGLAYAGLGRAAEALRHGRRATELLPVERDAHEGPLYIYLLAQIHVRLGQYSAAFERLDEVLRRPGFYNATWIERDPAFAGLRNHPRYRDFIANWKAAR